MDETRRVLKIILISARSSLTVQQLTEAYREVTGCDIPLEELGYWDLMDFLSDIPEILTVKGNNLDSEVTLSQPKKATNKKGNKGKNNGFYMARSSTLSGPSSDTILEINRQTRLGGAGSQETNHLTRDDNNADQIELNNCNKSTTYLNSDYTELPDVNVRLTLCSYSELLEEQGYVMKTSKGKSKKKTPERFNKEEQAEEEEDSCNRNIPKYLRDHLKELIGEFPEGIWCSQLPDIYQEKFGRELSFNSLGYSSLIFLCMELEDIFHYSDESSYDLKLYDARKPMPNIIFQDDNQEYTWDYSINSSTIVEEEWHMPEEAVDTDVVIPRDFVTLEELNCEKIHVVAAEIYDLSKFWLYRDDGRLDSMTEAMNTFYDKNRDRYLIPTKCMEIGRYCVAFTLNQYNRCVIVKMQPDASFVNVFYIDYGTLGTIPKDQIWFLTKDFVVLPAQAIRATLADIYPPTEYSAWSPEAINRFFKLADMKQLEARITRLSLTHKVIEVYLGTSVLTPGGDINSILVEEGHALYTNQVQKKNVLDSNCLPKFKHIYLMPSFDDIEHWFVPSGQEMEEFSSTDLTAAFFFLHYFWRPINEDDSVQNTVKKLMKRQDICSEYLRSFELLKMENMQEIMKTSYGHLYHDNEEKLSKSVEEYKSLNPLGNWVNQSTHEY